MISLKIYLDNCCFNRPYDEQVQPKVVLETMAKLYIQKHIQDQKLKLVWSYVLRYENSQNISEAKRDAIAKWEKLSCEFIGRSDEVYQLANKIETTGIKAFDALHIACAIKANCDYLITVDKSMLKYQNDKIVICNPIEFVNMEVLNDK